MRFYDFLHVFVPQTVYDALIYDACYDTTLINKKKTKKIKAFDRYEGLRQGKGFVVSIYTQKLQSASTCSRLGSILTKENLIRTEPRL